MCTFLYGGGSGSRTPFSGKRPYLKLNICAKFFQYFMKKLGGKNPEMEEWEKKLMIRVQFKCFIFPFFPIYREGGLFCKIYIPVF